MDEPPTDEVLDLRKKGMGNEDIVKNLQDKNYNPEQIGDAINQAGIKENIDAPEMEAPSPSEMENSPAENYNPEPTQEATPSFTPQPQRGGREMVELVQQVAESVVEEKWEDLMSGLGNIALWKEKTQTDVRSIKQEILRIEERLNNLQTAVVGKIGDFDKHMVDVGSEIKALEKVMEKIIEPLSENIRELNKVTEKLKERTKK